LTIPEAREEIDGVSGIIEGLKRELLEQLLEHFPDMEYLSPADIFEALGKDPDNPPEVIERAFKEHFSVPSPIAFNKTLFHFLLTKLGKIKSRIAVEFCLGLIESRPEETEYVLRYLDAVDLSGTEIGRIVNYLMSADSIYGYQQFLLMRWFYEQNIRAEDLVKYCREQAFNHNSDRWCRTYCLLYLGKCGNRGDLNNIENKYGELTNDLDKAEYAFALMNQEVGRRNAFYARIRDESILSREPLLMPRRLHSKQSSLPTGIISCLWNQ